VLIATGGAWSRRGERGSKKSWDTAKHQWGKKGGGTDVGERKAIATLRGEEEEGFAEGEPKRLESKKELSKKGRRSEYRGEKK